MFGVKKTRIASEVFEIETALFTKNNSQESFSNFLLYGPLLVYHPVL
tara:strand:+ start:99 stop:239 length:141 start_codon:yes stop_codon:yes gene_type:complete